MLERKNPLGKSRSSRFNYLVPLKTYEIPKIINQVITDLRVVGLGMAIGLPAPMEGVINEVIIIYIYILKLFSNVNFNISNTFKFK